MSEHTYLCCEILKLLALLDKYIEEYEPVGASVARVELEKVLKTVQAFRDMGRCVYRGDSI